MISPEPLSLRRGEAGMIIVSAAGERFAAHFATMLHSAWPQHPEAEFYLLDCGLEPHTHAHGLCDTPRRQAEHHHNRQHPLGWAANDRCLKCCNLRPAADP